MMLTRKGWPSRNGLLGVIFALFLAGFVWTPLLMMVPAPLWAQAPQGGEGRDPLAGTLFSQKESLFPNDGRINVLVVALNPFGLTESAAEQIGLILQKNLSNSGHFAVVGPREMNAFFENERPDLVDCREIACGVDAGKRLRAQMVLVGTIRSEKQQFILQIRLIDTLNNITDYDEEIHFTDASMDEDLFRLASNLSRNSILTGRVLSTSIRGIVISLGKRQGLKVGDFLVVYKQELPITNLQGDKIDTQKKNIAIVKVLNVNENSSEAILAHRTEEPQVSHFAQTYLDPVRQIDLVENTRKELDTGLRLEIRIRPLELAPVLLADNERKKWQIRMKEVERENKFWFTVEMVAGAATVVFLNNFDATSSDRLQTAAALGTASYAFWRTRKIKEEINDLHMESRAKGFSSSLNFHLQPTPAGIGLGLTYRF